LVFIPKSFAAKPLFRIEATNDAQGQNPITDISQQSLITGF